MAGNTMDAPQFREREVREPVRGSVRREMPPEARARVPMEAPAMTSPAVAPATAVVPARDRVRWGPIWAGLIATLASFLVLESLALGLGLLTSTTTGGGVSAANPWVSGIALLIAFFIGGWVAEATSAVRGTGAGILNGLMVWGLGTTLFLLLSVAGLGTLFGALGNVIGQFLAANGGAGINPGNVNVNGSQVTQITQAAGWGAFITLVLTAILAALGGLVASRGRAIGWLMRE